MKRKKILLADDVNLFIELEKTFFRREGFELLVARNGHEALEAVRTEKPDLVFMDLYMPEMNGDEACKRIKNDPELESIPVIMVTHGGREDDLERCRLCGSDDIVLKPISRHNFLATARKYLEINDRAAPRAEGCLKVRYGAEGHPSVDATTANIGPGGVYIETKEDFSEGTLLDLILHLPGDKEILCRGEVIWVNSSKCSRKPALAPGVGVEFLDVRYEDQKALQSYIRDLRLSPS